MSRRTLTATLVAALAATSLLAGACVPDPPPEPPAPEVVARDAAAGWLKAQFAPGGLIPSPFDPGQPARADSATAVASLESLDAGGTVTDDALADLLAEIDAFVLDGGGADRPGALARLIMAVVASGGDPRDAGGVDLVARLEATMITSGPATGRFGVQDPTYDGVFRQGLALAALSLVEPTPAAIDPAGGAVEDLPAVAWLLDQQCTATAAGAWMGHRADPSITDCGFDPVTFADVDTNATALAIVGLDAVGATPGVDPLPWVLDAQSATGAWSYNGGEWSPDDPDSTGLVLAALESLGAPAPTGALDALLGFQFTAATAPAPADAGAFWYPPWQPTDPKVANLLATNDALVALLPGTWPANLES